MEETPRSSAEIARYRRALFRRQGSDALASSGRPGGDSARVIVARFGFVALEPHDAEAAEGRGIERVAERNQRAGVAGRGGADEERAGGRDIALGEGGEAFGAEPARFVDRDRQRRCAEAADGLRCRRAGSRSAVASLLIATLSIG